MSDNDTAFTSMEFQTFMKRNGIRHVRCAPYHPSSNGLAEWAVQTFKEAMKKTKSDIDVRIVRFFFIQNHTTCNHRPVLSIVTSETSTQISIDQMVPDVGSRVQKNQECQKMDHDRGVKVRSFALGDAVFVKNFNGSPKVDCRKGNCKQRSSVPNNSARQWVASEQTCRSCKASWIGGRETC